MAVVWAKQSGNWNSTAIWAFWNETTQQIGDYGQLPQSGDIVYLNSFNVAINVLNYTYIEVAEIHNGLNPYTNRNGGYIDFFCNDNSAPTFTFDASFIGKGKTSNDIIIRIGVDGDQNRRQVNLTINGNITNCYFLNDHRYANNTIITGNVSETYWYSRHGSTGATRSMTITGNVSNFNFWNQNNSTTSLTINGNVTNINTSLILGSAGKTCNINGSIKFLQGNEFIHNVSVNGIADLSDLASEDTIEYPFASGYGLLKRTDITIKTIKLTDYPAEYNVKKDVVYDFGNKVGVLEPVITSTTNTINIYKRGY